MHRDDNAVGEGREIWGIDRGVASGYADEAWIESCGSFGYIDECHVSANIDGGIKRLRVAAGRVSGMLLPTAFDSWILTISPNDRRRQGPSFLSYL